MFKIQIGFLIGILLFVFFLDLLAWKPVWYAKDDIEKTAAIKTAAVGAAKYLDKFSEILESNGESLENTVNYKLKEFVLIMCEGFILCT